MNSMQGPQQGLETLDSTENPRSFKKYRTPPYAGRRTKFAPVKSLDSTESSSEFSDRKIL